MASFRNIYTSLMLVIAGSTSKELVRQVSYLKAENQILRSRLPERLILTHREKNRLVKFAKNLGSALNELATIVHPSTIRRWIWRCVGQGCQGTEECRPTAHGRADREANPQVGEGQLVGLHADSWRAEEAGNRVGDSQHCEEYPQAKWLRYWSQAWTCHLGRIHQATRQNHVAVRLLLQEGRVEDWLT